MRSHFLAARARHTIAIAGVLCLAAAPLAAQSHATSVGMRIVLEELPLPGTELRAKPVADPGAAAAIVRVLNVFPHGDGFRYNLEVTPFVAGSMDVGEFLERVDGTPTGDLPAIPLEVRAVLPVGKIQPNELATPEPERIGGYTTLLVVGGVVWVLGLLALLFVGRRKRIEAAVAERAPLTLADRLRPLVDRARDGALDNAGRAQLERLVFAHWRDRRQLHDVKIAEAIVSLRRDDEAGPLLRQLERWLHRPARPGDPEVDVAALLEPYRHAVASESEATA